MPNNKQLLHSTNGKNVTYNQNNIISDIMDLRRRYVISYNSNFVNFSNEFRAEQGLDEDRIYELREEKNNITNEQLNEMTIKNVNHIEKENKRSTITEHAREVFSGNNNVDYSWIQFLNEKLENGNITMEHFLLGAFMVVPDYGVIQEQDMIDIIEDLSMRESAQSDRINKISSYIGTRPENLKMSVMKILVERANEYQEIKKEGIEQKKLQKENLRALSGLGNSKNLLND